ncbi:PREDICTED: AT-rich interactive domain-containing protein 2-like [Camelina sativa]|uniref:AT-rich interactive domain-containing protein 2-like n=1 Tax=Camelina sativa TaxID=90675 RepID=A0ABM0U2U4_CAMSA|nr:PREDICTED: AT-rich interactive domain-containing protein 2-like [Camelina sativa]
MAGCSGSNFSSGPYIDVRVEYLNECENRLKKLFRQALLFFLEEEANGKPLPVILGNGKKVNLFKLFVFVCEIDGFDSVSWNGLWELVAEKLGLDSSVSPTLRLVYSKYLNRLEKWVMENSRKVKLEDPVVRKIGSYVGLLHELGFGLKSFLENGKRQKRNRAVALGCKNIEESHHRKKLRHDNNNEGVGTSCPVVSDASVVCLEQQVDIPEMLKWLTSVAISPHDPSIGVIPHSWKWKKFTGKEYYIQVIKAKNALLLQRHNAAVRFTYSPLMGNLTVHPSMYDDQRPSLGSLRYSTRNPKVSKHQSSGREVIAGTCRATGLQVPKQPQFPRRNVGVGPRYQAVVDEWTEPGLESDSKWLGTRVWPPLENNEAVEDLVGKGRAKSCSCDTLISNSVECIRFHIAENRMELRRDLGDVFFHWRFNQMGEEVSLRWTEREEKKFKMMMISNPKSLWKNAARLFRGKNREELVHYYFNVFLINRRRYQNRVTPRHIDSDDDSESFGSVGPSYGRSAVTSPDSDIMICSQNSQCGEVID